MPTWKDKDRDWDPMSDQNYLTAISFTQRTIGLSQLQVQRNAIKEAILQVELNLSPETNRETWALYDNLKLQMETLGVAEREFKRRDVKKKRFWDTLRIQLYKWATKERFD